MAEDALRRCVEDPDTFASTTWGQRASVHRGGSFTDLLDVDDVEQLLGLLARRPGFRLARDGTTLSFDTYTTSTRVAGHVVDQVADLDRILDLVVDGATVVLQGLHRTWAPLRDFCADLQRSVSHPVQANAYLSPPGAAAFRRHADRHAVFALQVGGCKRWDVEGLGEVVMGPGDVLYVPEGTPHEARSADTFSLHLTIGVLVVSWADVLRRSLGAGALRDPLPLGFASEGRAAELEDGLARAIEVARTQLAGLDPAALAARAAERARQGEQPARGGRLRAAVDPSSVHVGTRVRRRTTAVTHVDGERIVVRFDGRQLLLPRSTQAALESIVERAEVTVGELPELDTGSQEVLVRRLVREGLLAPVDPLPGGSHA